MHQRSMNPRARQLARALRPLALATPLLAGLASAPAALAQATQHYDIPAGPLAATLGRLGAQAGILLSFTTAQTEGRLSPGVRGALDVPQALAAALAGTGLRAVPQAGGWQLQAAPAAVPAPTSAALPFATGSATLAEVRVTAQAEDPVTEGSGSYAGPTTTASATGLRLSIRETPQTVTVVTQQQMRDQASFAIADVMQNAAGISAQRYDSERWMFSARGFVITNFLHDGVPRLYDGIYDWGATNLDMVFYDRVEIVKGATGLLSGSGMPSAAINFVRKRPAKEFGGSVSLQAGSFDHRRAEVDLSTPLNADKSVRARVAAAHQDQGSVQDHYRQKLSALYGIVEADLAPGTRATVGADYQHVDPRGTSWTGLPVFFSDGSRTDFARELNPAATWSRRLFTNNSVFAVLDHQFTPDWRLKVEANSLRSRHDSVLASASGGYPERTTGEGMYLFSGAFRGDRTQNTVHASLEGRYTLLGRRHDAAFGATWTDARTDGPTFEGQYPLLSGSIFQWDGSYPEPVFARIGDYADRTRQIGLYASTRLRPTNQLAVILGLRTSRVDVQHRESYTNGTADYASQQKESALTPYAGVVFELDGVHALYASYTSIFEPQPLRTMAGDYLDPLRGKALEAGVKADYLDGQLQASAAVFHIRQENLAEYAGYVGDFEERYKPVAGVRSRGVELQVAGRITPAWNVNASYTYAHIRSADGQPVFGSQLMTTLPAHTARLFTTYRLPGAASAWKIGGGVRWQSAFDGKVWPPSETATDYAIVRQKGYALVDLTAQFDVTPKLTLSASVRNLFDRRYYAGMGLFETAYRGEARSALVTVHYRF